MPSHKRLAGVVNSVLGRFVSRCGSHQGYWLMGWFVLEGQDWAFELFPNLSSVKSHTHLSALASLWADQTLQEQLFKHGLEPQILSRARLELKLSGQGMPAAKATGLRLERSRQRLSEQRCVTVMLTLVSARGKLYQNAANVYAAAHHPNYESRSGQ